MKIVSEDIFVRALSKQLGLTRADLNALIPPEALAKVPSEVAEEYEVIPVALLDEGKTLAIATSDPLNLTVIDYVRSLSKLRVIPQVASASAIRAAIARLYQIDADRVGELRIMNNSEDSAFGNAGGLPPRSGLELSPRGPNQTGPYARSAPPASSSGSNPRISSSGSMPPVAMSQQPTPYPGNSYLTPAQGIPAMAYAYQAPGMYPAMPSQASVSNATGSTSVATAALPEDLQRREVVALKALVELLVQKGVISLDEYLARLKR
jgi:hypothetical protein